MICCLAAARMLQEGISASRYFITLERFLELHKKFECLPLREQYTLLDICMFSYFGFSFSCLTAI